MRARAREGAGFGATLLKLVSGDFFDDGEDAMIVTRGFYDGQGSRAYTKVSGFIRAASGQYDRFEETVYNTAFDLDWVRTALLELGCRSVHFAHVESLDTPIADPEAQSRVFVVAQR